MLRVPSQQIAAARVVAVLGPTQVGKSSIVNLLLGAELAGVSPLAGFTTRPEGFRIAPDPPQADALEPSGLPWPVRPADRPPGWPDGAWLIWDTPDFDTLAAGRYREDLLSVAATSGSFVVVLSAEKYADLSVWQLLRVLAMLERPVVFVLNKVPAGEANALLDAFREHVRTQLPAFAPASEQTLWLPLTPQGVRPADPQAAGVVEALRRRLTTTPVLDASRLKRDAARLIRGFWDAWTAPVRAEHAAVRRFRAQVDEASRRFVQRYREMFLDDPQRYDTLHRVTAELLTLLDIPYLARWLGRARWFAGLPGRLLMRQLARLRQHRAPAGHHACGSEQHVLGELVEQTLVGLTRFCLRQAESADAGPFWQALSQRLEAQEAQLRQELEDRIRQHDEAFRAEIRAAAEELYARIRENPTLLNSLRAGRVGADLAGVAVALKTAGTGLGELVLTPVMLLLTQSLTEGTLGVYMQRVAARLRQRQLEHLERDFVEAELRPRLTGLLNDLKAPGVWNISEDDLAAAEAEIDELENAA